MESLLTEFTHTVAAMNQVLNDLTEMGQKKQQLIVKGQVRELDNLICQEGTVISNLEKIEGARFHLQVQIGQKWGVRAEEISAQEILERAEKEYPFNYHDLYDVISQLDYNLTRLKVINTLNSELIEHSLDYIKLMESIFSGDVSGIYSSQGIQTESSHALRSLVDKKV